MQLNLTDIHFTYPGSVHEAVAGLTVSFPVSWCGIIGDNGCGKTTLAKLIVRQLKPDTGSIFPDLVAAYCPQDTHVPPADLEDFALDFERDTLRLRDEMRIDDAWLWRFDELSSGQRKRIQIAVALWKHPDVLVLDEPTNHLDILARRCVLSALKRYGGIGILISHDRDLLDALVSRCLIFDGSGAHMVPGTYSQATQQVTQARTAASARQHEARAEQKRLEAERQRRREVASHSDALRSRKGLSAKDHDAREKIGRAIVSGKDGIATRQTTLLNARIARAEKDRSSAFVEKRYNGQVPCFGALSRRSYLAHLSAGVLTYGKAAKDGSAALEGDKDHDGEGLTIPELYVGPSDHIGIVGANGTGKSTLVRALVETFPADVSALVVEQELPDEKRLAARERLAALSSVERGRVLSVIAQLNSRPEAFLEDGELSPGELRKLIIGEAILDEVEIIVMDEPTNHLDLHSVEALAVLLREFVGAVILVSHDMRIIHEVCTTTWELRAHEAGTALNSRMKAIQDTARGATLVVN
ncbi:MAG: ATP-binding cassette domain-containing protein [Atopobiaceae bacterium]|jgi:macrolide transport system ATP-binding/permease protein